jgi:ribonuclease E
MSKKLLIDASHIEEVRVAVINGKKLEEFDSETTHRKLLKGNIYLAKVMRVEPSLQAAFVEYGSGRQGFLPFSEIHPDYYQIPVSDREKVILEKISAIEDESIIAEIHELADIDVNETKIGDNLNTESNPIIEDEETDIVQMETDIEEVEEETKKKPRIRGRRSNKNSSKEPSEVAPRPVTYKIQEVIKRRQILLIQVMKEERGNKGAAVTTYLSLAGRYCVLMPNAGRRNGGISKKIGDVTDRSRLRTIIEGLNVPEGMSLIVRTAGQERRKTEIKRDYEYLVSVWEKIRELTMKSVAPALIHEEIDLIKRVLRDMYDNDIEEILIEGDEAYKTAKKLMKMMIPSHTKKVQPYKNEKCPLFHAYNVESQLDEIINPICSLPSGGSIVVHITEALVAIDINSGKSTKERTIDDTALNTNLEAADEIARQLRLRDLAGLIVIDFIDMYEPKHIQQVERRLKEALKGDRARIQLGRISQFGLMELSRQRLRPSLLESYSTNCQHCHGSGFIRSIESSALQILRAVEGEAIKGNVDRLLIQVPDTVDLYLLNQKRDKIVQIESRFGLKIIVEKDSSLLPPLFNIDVIKNNIVLPKKEDAEEKKPHIAQPARIPQHRHKHVQDQKQPEQAKNSDQLKKHEHARRPEHVKKAEHVKKIEPLKTTEPTETTEENMAKLPEKTENHRKKVHPYRHKRFRKNNHTPRPEGEHPTNPDAPVNGAVQKTNTSEPKVNNHHPKPRNSEHKTNNGEPRINNNENKVKSPEVRPQQSEPKPKAPESHNTDVPSGTAEEKKNKGVKKRKSWLRRLLET